MKNLYIGDIVILSDEAKNNTYEDMDQKDEKLIITDVEIDNEGCGFLYSFDSLESDKEIICSLYSYEINYAQYRLNSILRNKFYKVDVCYLFYRVYLAMLLLKLIDLIKIRLIRWKNTQKL